MLHKMVIKMSRRSIINQIQPVLLWTIIEISWIWISLHKSEHKQLVQTQLKQKRSNSISYILRQGNNLIYWYPIDELLSQNSWCA